MVEVDVDSLDDIDCEFGLTDDDSDNDDDNDNCSDSGAAGKILTYSFASKKLGYEPVTVVLSEFDQRPMDMLLPQERKLLELVRARHDKEKTARKRRQTCWFIFMLVVFLGGLTVGAANALRQQHLR